jgi:spermidine synthase/Tfp pilus assembly protein PilF
MNNMGDDGGYRGKTIWLLPELSLFLAGMGMMTAQLAAGRLLAGDLGQSLYTWSATLAVFLFGLAMGNLAGGRWADRGRGICDIRNVLLLGALSVMAMLPLNAAMGRLPWWPGLSWPVRILMHAAAVALPAAFACGMVSPLVIRSAMLNAAGRGRAFGRLYAWGVLGNLAGTFLTGFVLFARLPVSWIVGIAAAWLLLPAAGYSLPGLAVSVSPRPREDLPPAGRKPWAFSFAWSPCLLAGGVGAAVMILELAAGRLLAQYFGQSLYSWTTAIGVVFAGMSLGTWAGGRLVDRFGPARLLPWLLVLASLGMLAVPWLHYSAGEQSFLWEMDLPHRLLAHGMGVFFLPAGLLGVVIAAVAAMAIADPERLGRSVGGVYAAMSVGSIVGTLTAGFLLFGSIGTRMTLAGAAALLAVGGATAGGRRRLPWYWAITILALVGCTIVGLPGAKSISARLRLREKASPRVLFQEESAYSLIAVKEDADNPRIRRFFMDRLQHSIVNLDDPLDLRYHYQQIFAGALAAARPGKDPVHTLIIGGGGYTFPKYLALTRPGSDVEVAEIDPVVTRAAAAAFGLSAHTVIRSHHLDAGLYVHERARRLRGGEDVPPYDAVFGDSINHLAVPFHLLTVEFLREVRSLLAPDGIYCLILIDSLDNGRMVGAAARTCREVFPSVAVFTTHDQPASRDTLVLVASATPLALDGLPEEIAAKDFAYRGRRLSAADIADLEARVGSLVLTADFAPVDDLIRDLVREDSEDKAEVYFRLAGRHRRLGQYAEAIALCRKALVARPGWAAAYCAIGLNHASLGEHGLAVMAFQEAVGLQPDSANLLYNLGVSLKQIDDVDGAIDAFAGAVECDPAYAKARFNLASLLHLVGDYADSMNEWEGYLAIEPESGEGRYRYAMALWRCHRLAEARDEARKARDLGVSPDPEFMAILEGRDSAVGHVPEAGL